jgi:hypothetical protein
MANYFINKDQYDLLSEKRQQFKSWTQSGYASGLDEAWKKKAGEIYTLLTGKVHNLSCGACIGNLLSVLDKAMKQYEEKEAILSAATSEEVPDFEEAQKEVDQQIIRTLQENNVKIKRNGKRKR